MRRLLRILLREIGIGAAVLLLLIGILWIREWRPAAEETLYPSPGISAAGLICDTLSPGDTLRILSWNIGYAGLGDDMDFFYDGGRRMRTSEARTVENLHRIIRFLQQLADAGRADIILLQEIDLDSRRSYHIREYDSLRVALPDYTGWVGLNYASDFVPLPATDPMGSVESGIAIFSRLRPSRVTRYGYPSGFPFPVRLFNLKRCLLTWEIPVRTSDSAARAALYIGNTHNTAYDTGDMRSQELAFLRDYLSDRNPYHITMGDWNSCPPGYTPSPAALEDPCFRPISIDRQDFPADMTFVCDPTTPSVRYGYEPYHPRSTTTAVIDFALCGPGIEPVAIETIDLGFRNSDHNPVAATFVIR